MERYEKLGRVGEGAHGVVYKARLVQPLATHPLPPRAAIAAQVRNEIAEAVHDETKESLPHASLSTIVQTPDRAGGVKRHRDGTPASMLATRLNDARLLESPASTLSTSSYNFAVSATDAMDTDTALLPVDTIVAIKKIRLRSLYEGLSLEAIREIKYLQELHHPNIITIYDIFNHNANINVVMDYMHYDLEALVKDASVKLTEPNIKTIVHELLRGVEYCHSQWILHRDLKPGNVLLNTAGQIKLTDFGLAKMFGTPERKLSPQACTMWYRAPELLFGSQHYGAAMDLWSVGCVLGELVWRRPMFAGEESEIKQLQRIFSVLGTPAQNDWTDAELLPAYVLFNDNPSVKPLKELFRGMEDSGIDLLRQLLALNPAKRISASDALKHAWFRCGASMTPAEQLPVIKKFRAEKEQWVQQQQQQQQQHR